MKRLLLIVFLIITPLSQALALSTITNTSLGEIYVDDNGRSLYIFLKDPVNKSVCNQDCEKLWPPFLVEEGLNNPFLDNPSFSQIVRDNGRKQWALNGKALYRWVDDKKSGDITGAGFKGLWSLARADDVTVKLYGDGKLRYLVDSNNLALYTFDKDTTNQSECYNQCAVKWPPAYVELSLIEQGVENLTLTGDFGVSQRKDNRYQWTYQDKPLYLWFKDAKPGDISGNGVQGVWHLVTQ